MRYFISVFVAVFMVSSQAFAAPDNSADSLMDFVKDRYSVMLDIVNKHNANKDKMRAELRKAMDTFVDFDEMAQRTLAGHWDTLNKKQRSNFVAEFKLMLQRTYIKKFDGDTAFTIEYRGDPEFDDKGTAMVRSVIRVGKSSADVDYAFHVKKGKFLAYDVVIDEISMVRNYRKQFGDIIGKEGFKGLMDRLTKRNQEEAAK
ncbi:MAG: Toluene tolerance, Ttg2 [Deltaproteobacteria bacterium ADurb.Bin058]|nr:MAG: Toluene tolerance, Ttg2 [Deltaproteobacteria bacterium ADurb.Bin058]